jgi:hypothetical protein
MTAQYEQLTQFLKALDGTLKKNLDAKELFLIGGAAITLAYDDANRTSDLDLIEPPTIIAELGKAKSTLAKKYRVYISALAEINFAAPADWKKKCQEIKLGLKHIRLMVPCLEDICLGKMARLEPKDFEDIIAVYENGKLKPKKLLKRLSENLRELKNSGYRNNAILLFQEIFGMRLAFQKGKPVIKS